MRLGITSKLFAAILATNLAIAVAFGTAVQISVDRGFRQYVEDREQRRLQELGRSFETAYAERGNWDFLRSDPDQWRRLSRSDQWSARRGPPPDGLPPDGPPRENEPGVMRSEGKNPRGEGGEGRRRPPPPDFPSQAKGFSSKGGRGERGPPPPLTLLDATKHFVQGDALPSSGALAFSVPLTLEGETIGWLGVPRLPLGGSDTQFLEHQLKMSWVIGGLALLVAATVSILLARNFLAPIRRLVDATHRLASGDYGQRVTKTTRDELGQLVEDFNQLAATLQEADTRRRAFLADVSHELRTPLAVLRGELEALQDGIRSLTPEAIRSLQAEVATLTALVNDLYDLALVDSGEAAYDRRPVDFADLVRVVLRGFEQRFAQRGIAVDIERVGTRAVMVCGDSRRLMQLLNNVLENSHRYTDPGGRVEVALAQTSDDVILEIQDSAPGVPPDLLPRLFERLFRVETSRNRASGGAGLGLSLCRSIAEAHGGEITASASALGGLKITLRLPALPS